MKAVKIHDLYKRFGAKEVIRGLSLEIDEGEIFGLLGPNGAGKSTTINMLCYLLGYDKGEIWVFEKSHQLFAREIKSILGMVPQELALFEELTAYENVHFFGALYGLRKDVLTAAVKEAISFVGLENHLKEKAKTFSGGMKRRLNIACGIVHRPKLVIMDEPTVGIDPQSRHYILQAIKKLKEQGTTIIYTTHYMEEAEQLCDRIAIMDEGMVVEMGTTSQLKAIISDHYTLEVCIGAMEDLDVKPLKKMQGIEQIGLSEQKLTIVFKKEVSCIGSILEELARQHITVLDIHTKIHSLEDVFLALTGKKLRD